MTDLGAYPLRRTRSSRLLRQGQSRVLKDRRLGNVAHYAIALHVSRPPHRCAFDDALRVRDAPVAGLFLPNVTNCWVTAVQGHRTQFYDETGSVAQALQQ